MRAEQQAARYLQGQGLTLVERNFSCRCGEIDIVARDQSVWVFAEVKFRSQQTFGGVDHAISKAKQRKIINTAEFYLHNKGLNINNLQIRFDAVLIENQEPRLRWLKNAFGG
ncbi:YraN family protein [Alginatibacterium sediminis]|uniref:UPF0102 protein DBZ36_16145 n=2 Tax=Alginatibacterium sediminis TaxID=2164068 RepID=A0A420E987_9ALTE|nr:YraN family protein [Alginatibacterium sediminis]